MTRRVLGGPMPYGYRRAGGLGSIAIVKAEAETVRLVFDLRGDGKSMNVIADILNFQRIPAPKGGRWRASAVYHSILKQARKYSGATIRRLHNGARWPAILGADVDLDQVEEPEPEPIRTNMNGHKGSKPKRRYNKRK